MSIKDGILLPALLFSLGSAVGCRPHPVVEPGDISFREFVVPCPRAHVFDDALEFAQASNLAVAVLEKSSGLIKFERATLDPIDLDAFCEFPLRDAKTDAPFSTFWEWNQWWAEGIVDAKVFLNVLMSEKGSTQTGVNIRGNWTAVITDNAHSGITRNYVLDSTGVLEGMLRQHLIDSCDGRASPNVIARVRKFSNDYAALRDQYNEGNMKEVDYETQRDQLLEDFHHELTELPVRDGGDLD